MHASCAARPGPDGYDAILLLGPPGAGKSDFLLRLIHDGFSLVADDQVVIWNGIASAPAALAGLLEVRGLGIFHLPHLASAPLRLVISLGAPPARLPEPQTHVQLGLPLVIIDPAQPSAVARAVLALEAACGRLTQVAGSFAP
ncbi:HPr kinase/phosphorylase [Acidocella aquatica]